MFWTWVRNAGYGFLMFLCFAFVDFVLYYFGQSRPDEQDSP